MLTKHERLAFSNVMVKAFKECEDELKGEVKQELMELNQENGTSQIEILVDGKKCGTVSINRSTPKIEIEPGNKEKAIAYLEALQKQFDEENKEAHIVEVKPVKGWEQYFSFDPLNGSVYCTVTGEDVSDLFYYEPEHPTFATVRVNKDKTVEAFKPLLHDLTLDDLFLPDQKLLGGEVSD